jgi:hypothetical protein
VSFVLTGIAVDRWMQGTVGPWLPLLTLGPAAMAAGVVASNMTARFLSKGSKLVFVLILVVELVVTYLAWSYAYRSFVQGWR